MRIWLLTNSRRLMLVACCAFPGCGLTPEDEAQIDLARRELDVGNSIDALKRYSALAASLAPRSESDAAAAQTGEAVCLYQLGRLQEAAAAFAKIKPELLADSKFKDARLELHLYRGHTARELGREAEPAFLEDTPENRAEKLRRTQTANAHYQLARSQYSTVLTDLDARNMEALVGSAECLVRLGILGKSPQFFQKAATLLSSCPDQQEKRVLFFQGRVVQEDLGNGELTLEAAEKISDALLLDRDGNYDFHVAYRDLLILLSPLTTPPKLEAKFQRDPKLLVLVKSFIERLDGYKRQGRRPDGDWGAELDRSLTAYMKEYQGWQNNRTGLKENVVRAYQLIRAGQEKVYLEAYREALRLLEVVDPEFQKEEEYIQTRKEIQQGYVLGNIENGKLLTDIGEWDLADSNLNDALSRCDRNYVKDVDKLLIEAQRAKQQLFVQRSWTTERERLRMLLSEGSFEQAEQQYELVKARYKPEEKPFLDAQFKEFNNEVNKREAIAELIRLYQEGLKAPTPTRALELFSDALARANKENLTYWKLRLQREVAGVYYKLDDFQRCLDEMSVLAKNLNDTKVPLNQNDYLIAGMSYYQKGDFEQASRNFDEIKDPASLAPGDLKAAGICYLKRSPPSPNRARAFLERAASDDPEVRQALKGSYRQLYDSWKKSDRGAAMEVLISLTALDPQEHEARKDLGILLYQVGKETKDPEVHRQAYQHLVDAARGGAEPQTDEEKECFGRLVACYARYMPLVVGNTWTYKVSDGNTRVVRVTDKVAADRFKVRIEEGSAVSEEVWEEAEAGKCLKRHNAVELVTQEVPIQLYAPDFLPSRKYNVRVTQFHSRVEKTGLVRKVGNQTHSNCMQIRIATGPTTYRDVFLAPGVGEIEMRESSNFGYVLSAVELRGETTVGNAR